MRCFWKRSMWSSWSDGTEILTRSFPPLSNASSHPKGAFQIRNRQMVKRSDLVVFYVDHTGGGAYQTMRYAQKEKKNILNLAGEGYGEKE